MKDKTLYIIIGLLCLAFLGLGLAIGYDLAPEPKTETKVEFVNVPIIQIDTLKQSFTKIRKDTLIKYDTALVEVLIRDTVRLYASKPFVSHFDTTATGGRVRLDYLFPENIITNLKVEPNPIRTIQTQTVYKERSIWIDILTHVGAAGIGYGIGYMVGAK